MQIEDLNFEQYLHHHNFLLEFEFKLNAIPDVDVNAVDKFDDDNIDLDAVDDADDAVDVVIDDDINEWFPFEVFKDVKKIGQGGFSQIFKANWKINEGISGKDKVNRQKLEPEIVLKVLNNSQNVDTEFLKELIYTFHCRSDSNIIKCYGVTQDPQTKNYAFVLKYKQNGDLHHFINKNFETFSWKKIGQGGFSQIFKANWKINEGISGKDKVNRQKLEPEIVLKVLNNSQNVDTEFLKELIYTFHCRSDSNIIKCYGVTQDPQTKNYAFVLKYKQNGDLHHFINKNFETFSWKVKINYLNNIVKGIKSIHDKKVIHRDLHSGNILVNNRHNSNDTYPVISDLGFSKPVNIDSNLSRESRIYGVIPYMAPELFKNQKYSYSSDIYSLGMIMWQMTSGHRPFHDQEHGPKLILGILDGKRPEITKDTPKCWANLMKRCWHPDPSQRPTIDEIYDFTCLSENEIKYHSEFNEAEKKRLEMIKSKKPFVKNPGYKHPNSRYYSTSLNSMLESINSTITDLSSNDNLLSNDHFDIMDCNSNQKNNFENSIHNSKSSPPVIVTTPPGKIKFIILGVI
ncbi:hypothetical protein Glove_346g163 [Diversispora epigaea]|uniref:Protein kinase domain-containing protein n=1 Tax=Diversispora epigaea TaxID=1348612 RepID=A0A397HEY8_9GLOM|nr:hypothetical protein Glove_346g163 [Diversispora epigaea]